MRVVVINSSPRKDGNSKTALMLKHLVKGMQDANAAVDVIHLREKTVNYCLGCSVCWIKTPGKCVFKDDMTREILPKFLEADLAVVATPLYNWIMNANLKAFLERLKPADLPYLMTNSDGISRHPMRTRYPAVVLLSVCASYDNGDYFTHLSTFMKMLFHKTLIAEILRPESETMVAPVFEEKLQDILQATEQAGREIVTSLQISEDTLKRVRQPISDSFEFVFSMANVIWQTCIDKRVLPNKMINNNIMPDFDQLESVNEKVARLPVLPRPESIEQFRTLMKMKYTPQTTGELTAKVQFKFKGEVEGACYLVIEDTVLKSIMGKIDAPDLTIEAPFDKWMDVEMGKLDVFELLGENKISIDGDPALMKQVRELFK